MLTLLLVLGAVTCSPVPSDPPALPDASHIEVTHEVRHVTYEVSEEVNEATASSHIPSDVPPEEDPPIPTVTTPHTVPEEQHPQDDSTEGHVAPPQPEDPVDEISQEASAEHEVTVEESLHEETESEEKETKVEPEEQIDALAEVKSSETDSSLESVELVPESHVFIPSDDEHDSQQEEEADVSGITSDSEEVIAPATPTEAVHSPVALTEVADSPAAPTEVVQSPAALTDVADSPAALTDVADSPAAPAEVVDTPAESEEVIGAEQSDSEDNTSPLETEPASEVITQVDAQESSDITAQLNDPIIEEDSRVFDGEVAEVVPSQILHETAGSEFLETEKRTDDEELPVHDNLAQEPVSESSDEVAGVVAPDDTVPETTRESRVYIEYEDEEPESEEVDEESTVPEQVKSHSESDPEPANSGLESMSMTSPTPESLPEDVPIVDDLEKEEAPPAEDQEEETVTVVPEMDSQEENSTLITDVEEPDIVPEVVINPPSSSIAPLPSEEYTDNYSDILESGGDLPDFDVTHEQLPSKDYPLPKEAQFIPEETHDHTGEVSEGESSDLAAGDHMLEVEAGTPRVLPPQQEQVSAAAPSALTPGCIVAIVFGVLLSLVVILGVGGFMVWQRRTQNRPKVLGNDQGYAGSDSGGYIDDQVRVSYVNSQTDTPKAQASETPQDTQGPQVFIRLKSLKPSLPAGATGMLKSLPKMPKITPMNMTNLSQIVTKRESGGSNKSGQ